jgi:soluble lytic murein transglycosylase-like protein
LDAHRCKLLILLDMLHTVVSDRRKAVRPGPDRRKAVRYRAVGSALVGLIAIGVAAPAQAQIYSWRDANGNLFLSNHRSSASSTVGGLANSTAVASAIVQKTPIAATGRQTTSERGWAYSNLIAEHSRLQGVRAELVRAVMQVESAFNPNARSPKGAMGLMQLMPSTMRQFGVKNPFNPAENVRAGVAYLRELLDRYQNNEELALAAYNAGPGAVDKHGQTVPPYRETRNYVAQINHMAARPIEKRASAIYKVADDTIDGRAVPRYSNTKPATGGYEVAAR